MNKFSVLILVTVVLFLCVLVAGFVYLESAGRPTSSFVVFTGGIVGPILAVLPVVYKQNETAKKIDTIGKNVNGNTTRLFDAATGGEPLQDDERARILGDLRQLPSHEGQQPPRHAAE